MARRQFEVIDIVEVLQRWHAGRPKSVVASSVGIDDKTVRKHVAPAEAAGLAPGGPPLVNVTSVLHPRHGRTTDTELRHLAGRADPERKPLNRAVDEWQLEHPLPVGVIDRQE
jgi:hypothetical protein